MYLQYLYAFYPAGQGKTTEKTEKRQVTAWIHFRMHFFEVRSPGTGFLTAKFVCQREFFPVIRLTAACDEIAQLNRNKPFLVVRKTLCDTTENSPGIQRES